MYCTAKVEWKYLYGSHPDDPVELRFTNYKTGVAETRTYKNHRAAKCAETKVLNRVHRIYGYINLA